MRVLYLVTAYPRGENDVITPWLVRTIHALGERGVDVEVLAPAYRGLGDHTVEGVRVHRFRYAPRGWETLTHDQTAPDRIRERPQFLALVPGYVAAGSAAAARLARSGRFDVLHAFWPLPQGLLGLAAKRVSGVPLVSTFFGVELSWLESDLPFLRPVLRRIVRRSDAVTAISSYTAARLARAVPGVRPDVIPFGASVEVPEELPPNVPSARFEVLFAGRLVERKGVQVAVRALGSLPERFVLRVIGEGPMRAELRELARRSGVGDRVRFDGAVARDDLERAFARCDAFVLPAVVDSKGDTEGLGVVLIEALGYGKPVVASGAGGITDIVHDGETGLLVPPGDAAALAAALLRIEADPAFARELGLAGRRFVAEKFSWARVVGSLEQLYGRVAASREPRLPAAAWAPSSGASRIP